MAEISKPIFISPDLKAEIEKRRAEDGTYAFLNDEQAALWIFKELAGQKTAGGNITIAPKAKLPIAPLEANNPDFPLPRGRNLTNLLSQININNFRISSDGKWIDMEIRETEINSDYYDVKIIDIVTGGDDDPLKNVLWRAKNFGRNDLLAIIGNKTVIPYLIGKWWYLRILD